MVGQTPLARYKAGPITSTVWENQIHVNGNRKTVLKTSVQGRYKDKSGTWKSTSSFSRNEIPLAIYCLQKAFEKIIETDNAGVQEKADDMEFLATEE